MINATITDTARRSQLTQPVAVESVAESARPMPTSKVASLDQGAMIAETLAASTPGVTAEGIKGQPDITPRSFDINNQPTDFHSIMANLQQILADSGSTLVQSRLALNQEMAAVRANNMNEALAAVDEAKRELVKANEEVQRRTAELELSKAGLADKTNQLSTTQNKFDLAQAQLDDIELELKKFPDDLQIAQKYQQQKAVVEEWRQTLGTAQEQHSVATSACIDAVNAAQDAAGSAIFAQTQVNDATDDLIRVSAQPATSVAITSAEVKTALQVLYDCMTRLSEIISKSNEERLGMNLKLFQERQDLLHKECMKASEDYQNAIRAAETKRGHAKVAGKILGWLGVAAASVAAICTGGALSGLVALASIAVMAADQGLEAQGKQTLSGQFIDPVMNKVMGAMLELVKACFPDMDDTTAQAIALVLTLVTLAAAGYGAVKAGGAVIGRASAVSPAFRAGMERFTNMALIPNSGAAPLMGKLSQVSEAVIHGTDAAVHAAMGIQLGQIKKHSSEMQATITTNNAVIAVIKRMLEELVDGYVQSNPSFDLIQKYTEWVEDNRSTVSHMSSARIV